MASLVLSLAGNAAGGALLGPIGAIAGRIVGAVVGNVIDHALFGQSEPRQVEGPRLSDLDVMASTEGAPIARVYGRARISGQVIWATSLEEFISTESETQGGKGGMVPGPTTTTTTYSYYANFAVGLCEGPIGRVARVWADGKPLDLNGLMVRVHTGSETQEADPLIVAKEIEGGAPAYRGLAYVVFEQLPLASFGNRIPQLSFEVIRPIGALEPMVRAVTLIPGTTEFGYEPSEAVQVVGLAQYAPENRHVAHAISDVEAALDDLQACCPNLERVALVVAWLGNDLRAQHCMLKPAIEITTKQTYPVAWSVAGLNRDTAHLVSSVNERPAYGGTPSDSSVVHLIAALKARGLKVTLYPFIAMDVPADNALPNPYTGAIPQPAYPWRGRITCDPAPKQPGTPDGTPDGTSAAADQLDSFFGTASLADFAVDGETVIYTGPDQWSFRRLVLHYAHLCVAAGGVDAFLIGSELPGLTRVRSGAGVYPAVSHLVTLADDVKELLGGETIVTYGADWTEYGAHVVDDDAEEVRFPLDPLWASPSIDAVGIDYYAPLADWRDGADHLDRAVTDSVYDRAYLAANLRGGEGYDWFYADSEDRAAQTRTPITDGLDKPWTFRVKDLWNWWANDHYERAGGSELGAPTGWVPHSKPIWLTEVGCPAVDKGANQPSTFPDPKSSDGGVPYFSNGHRDDLIQRRCLEAVLGALDPALGATPEMNPISPVYGGRMFDPSAIHLWTWDARPYPVFPAALDVWGDGPNWETGHWLTGRLGGAPLDALIAQILDDAGIEGFESGRLRDVVDGYLIDRPMAPRAAIEPLAVAYAFDAAEVEGQLAFFPRGGEAVMELNEDDLLQAGDHASARLVRMQETELPREVSLSYVDAGLEYRRAAVMSRRLVGGSARASSAELAVVTNDAAAERRANIWLQDVWAGRESVEFALPLRQLALTPGDIVGITINGRRRLAELRTVIDAEGRGVRARSIDPDAFDMPVSKTRRQMTPIPEAVGPVHALMLDLPVLPGEADDILTRAAVFADPWPGPVTIWRSFDGESFQALAKAVAPATAGELIDDVPPGPSYRWDRGGRIRVRLSGGALASLSQGRVLDGANAAAVRHANGQWEILQFASAELVGMRTHELSLLLRGQAGTEPLLAATIPAGAPFVLLNEALVPVATGLDALERPMRLRFAPSGRDHADASAVEVEVTPSAVALQPLAPVHLKAVRTEDGVVVSWTRRTRIAGDAWAVRDVPLGEEAERYEVDVLLGSSVMRTISTSTSSVLYPAEDEIADFGAPQPVLMIAVAQISSAVGRGAIATALLTP